METIEKAKYEGYLWYSDKKSPEVFRGDKEICFELDDRKIHLSLKVTFGMEKSVFR